MDYFEKIEVKPAPDLTWNLPEQKRGTVKIIGGSNQNFRTEIKTTEFLTNNYPIKEVMLVLPDSLKSQLPDAPNLLYVKSTESGSFADEKKLNELMTEGDFNLLLGDLSKNAETAKAFSQIIPGVEFPTLITRDAINVIMENNLERTLMNPQIIYLASMPQLAKMFQTVYYPKMLLMSQSLMQVGEALHKFTLSYPAKIITLHNEQILIAENGVVKVMALEKSGYQPFMFWNGEAAAKIVALNMFNPGKFIEATICGIWS